MNISYLSENKITKAWKGDKSKTKRRIILWKVNCAEQNKAIADLKEYGFHGIRIYIHYARVRSHSHCFYAREDSHLLFMKAFLRLVDKSSRLSHLFYMKSRLFCADFFTPLLDFTSLRCLFWKHNFTTQWGLCSICTFLIWL